MVEIAKCNGVGKQYVSRLIRLAFLAPEMVERIVAGRQPPELTTQSLQAALLIFQWIGRRKSGPSDLHRRSEQAPVSIHWPALPGVGEPPNLCICDPRYSI